jgi:hypothetical protein
LSGSDDYAGLWRRAGFQQTQVRDLSSITVDRGSRCLTHEDPAFELTPARCRGQRLVLFVEAVKTS